MKLRRTQNGLLMELSEAELDALQSGLSETLEALDDWEFHTRTGVQRPEMQRILAELREERRELGV